MKKNARVATGFLLLNSLIVGIHPIIARVRPVVLDSLLFACTTIFLEGLFLLPLALGQSKSARRTLEIGVNAGVRVETARAIPGAAWGKLIAACLVFGIATMIFFVGVDASQSALAVSLVLKLEVVYSLVVGHLLLHERVSARQAVLSLVAFGGLVLTLAFGQGGPGGFTASLASAFGLGELLLMAVPWMWLAGNILTKSLLERRQFTSIQLTCVRTISGGAFIMGFYYLLHGSFPWTLLLPGVPLLFVTCNAAVYLLAHLTWNAGIQRAKLSTAYQLKITSPVFTALFGAWVLADGLTGGQVLGFTILLTALVLIVRERRTGGTAGWGPTACPVLVDRLSWPVGIQLIPARSPRPFQSPLGLFVLDILAGRGKPFSARGAPLSLGQLRQLERVVHKRRWETPR